MTRSRREGFWARHSLSIVAILLRACWIVLYIVSDPSTHLGSLFGNAIADWTGAVVTVIATKYMYEKGSAESRQPCRHSLSPLFEKLRDHSLTIFLVVTGVGWAIVYARVNSEAKWGQVVGNIVSEWTQLLGLVWLTKELFETRSKESGNRPSNGNSYCQLQPDNPGLVNSGHSEQLPRILHFRWA